MSEPSSAMSFSDLILRVAREAGIAYYGSDGSEKAKIPVNEHDIDLCKKIVNDGIRMFIADAPIKGWRWMRRLMSVTMTATRITGAADTGTNATHLIDATLATSYTTSDELKDYYAYILTGTGKGSYAQITAYDESTGDCTVAEWLDENGNSGGTTPIATDTFAITPIETINGNISRYPLVENFGGSPDGPIHYAANTNHSSIILWRDEAFIRANRAVTTITSYPHYAAIKQFEPVLSAPSTKRRFELFLDPQPVAADTVEFPYTLYFDKLRLESGIATAAAADSLTDGSIANLYPNDYFNGWIITILSGTGKNSYAKVEDYTGSSGKFDIVDDDWLSIDGTINGTNPSGTPTYKVEPANNLHPAGFRFDEVIKNACLAQAEIQIEDMTSGWDNKYQKFLAKAYEIDMRSAPRSVGNMNHRDHRVRERTWSDVTFN